jgi:hypothetical protein
MASTASSVAIAMEIIAAIGKSTFAPLADELTDADTC